MTFKCRKHKEHFPDEDENRPRVEKRANSVSISGYIGQQNICKRCEAKKVAVARRLQAERDPIGYIINFMLHAARKSDKKKGIPFDLDVHRHKFAELVRNTEFCCICGGEFTEIYFTDNKGAKQPYNRSLDAITPNKGHVMGNVQIVHDRCNTLKGNCTQEELVALCRSIIEWSKMRKN